MRRQYHHRRVDGHVLIWDVHRLIALSRHLPQREVSLAAIAELDEAFWFDHPATCREVAGHARLIGETDPEHPIILSADGRVMDGMHRVCRALIEGRETIRAVRFPEDPEPDHIDVSLDDLSYDPPEER